MSISGARILLAGAGEGVGKSLITVGLVHELRRRGMSISCALSSSHLMQASLLKRLVGRPVRCLDRAILSLPQLLTTTEEAMFGSELLIIEGHRGLHDGFEPDAPKGSDADLARATKTPVLLIIDTRGVGASVAAIVRGYRELAQNLPFAGVILNRVDAGYSLGEKNSDYFSAALRFYNESPQIGSLQESRYETFSAPGFVSQGRNLTSLPRQLFVDLGRAIQSTVDLDRLIKIARDAADCETDTKKRDPLPRRTRIAVSDDACFALSYQDNIEILRFYGAEIIPFSPLADSELPRRIGGLYLSGAYLDEYANDLTANHRIRDAISTFARAGGALYSEGASTAFLCKEYVTLDGESHPGVGILDSVARASPLEYSRVTHRFSADSVLGRVETAAGGIDTGEWGIVPTSPTPNTASTLQRGTNTPVAEGYIPLPNALSTFSLLHFGSSPECARHFVDTAEIMQRV